MPGAHTGAAVGMLGFGSPTKTMAESLYDILGVSKTASDDEIRKAYRKLARKHHPDVNPGDADAEAKFKRVAGAYDVLSDKQKRQRYDEFGEDSLKGGFDPERARTYQSWKRSRAEGARPFDFGAGNFTDESAFDLGDLFGFGARRRRGPMPGADVQAVVDMELGQAIAGAEVRLEVPGHDKPVTVRIPPGAGDGSTIRLKGMGGKSQNGGPAGDLIIVTRVQPHPLIRRDGLDLTMRLPVTLNEAYNGAAIEIPTFDGPIKLHVPPRSQAGAKLRVRGKGVPRKNERGDLYVELDVRMPDREDDELGRALRESDASYTAPIRKELRL